MDMTPGEQVCTTRLPRLAVYILLYYITQSVLVAYRVINGVKDTAGFRVTFNLSQQSSGINGTCSEDVEESTLLVS